MLQRNILFPILIFIMFSGCALVQSYPTAWTEVRTHPKLGTALYNKSGQDFGDETWNRGFSIIEKALGSLQKCIGFDDTMFQELQKVPIVVIPPERIVPLHRPAAAFTDLGHVFIRSDFFDAAWLQLEWIHIYLYRSGKHFLGDPQHKDQLFSQCGSPIGTHEHKCGLSAFYYFWKNTA